MVPFKCSLYLNWLLLILCLVFIANDVISLVLHPMVSWDNNSSAVFFYFAFLGYIYVSLRVSKIFLSLLRSNINLIIFHEKAWKCNLHCLMGSCTELSFRKNPKCLWCVLVIQSCPTLWDPMGVARQTSLFMEFSRQEYWSGLLFPSPKELPNPRIEPWSPASQADSLPFELQGSPGPVVKNLLANAGDMGLVQEDSSYCKDTSCPYVRKVPWRREWQHTRVFLPGEFHEQRSLVDYSPWGHKEWDMTEWLTFSATKENLCPVKNTSTAKNR